MKLNLLLEGAGIKVPPDCCDCEVQGVTCDSRQVKPGFVFVAVPGTRTNGVAFIPDAVERGAVAVVTGNDPSARLPRHNSRGQKCEACHATVEDPRMALALLASVFHGRPADGMRVAGVTGTNGKTTVAYMVRDILRAKGMEPGLIGTVEYAIGSRQIPSSQTTPDAPMLQSLLAQMRGAGCKSVVMEVSSHSLDQKRVAGVDFDVAIFTNFTGDHLDYHGTMEGYRNAKMALFRDLGRGGKKAIAVVNSDDLCGRGIKGMGSSAEVLTYGTSGGEDVSAFDIRTGGSGSVFGVRSPWGEAEVHSRLMGRFNVSNSLAAFTACGAMGVEVPLISKVLSGVSNVRGRLEKIESGKGFSVFIDYAHTDDALRNVLSTLRDITAGRVILVFGCGGDRDRTKRPLMGATAVSMADYVVLTSDNPRTENPEAIMAEIRSGFGDRTNFTSVADRREGIRTAIAMAREGDVVLIAGKGHERFQDFANTKVSFDDRAVAEECF